MSQRLCRGLERLLIGEGRSILRQCQSDTARSVCHPGKRPVKRFGFPGDTAGGFDSISKEVAGRCVRQGVGRTADLG